MSITTYEGVVEKGKIRLKSDVKLPENVVVYVIVPEVQTQAKKTPRIYTPRLTHPRQAEDFKMKVGKA